MLGKDHSRRRLIYGALLQMPSLIYSQSLTCTKSKGWSYTMHQRCGTWQSRKLWLHFYDRQFRLTTHNCRISAFSLRANLLSRNTHIWFGGRMHWSSWIYAQSPLKITWRVVLGYLVVLMFCLSVFIHVINSWNGTLLCFSECICNAIIRSSM
jgi:hypothetical protein